jgi:hypothetical protein
MRSFLKIAGFLGILGSFFLLERRRRCGVKKNQNTSQQKKLAVAALGAVTIHFAESPVTYPLATFRRKMQRSESLFSHFRL